MGMSTIQTNTFAGVLDVRDSSNNLTAMQVSALQGASTLTPPLFQDSVGTQVGTLCRAWVSFRGRDTVGIQAAFNVSSITDRGIGSYTVNFTNALSSNQYCTLGLAASDGIANNGLVLAPNYNSSTTTTSSYQIATLAFSSNPTGSVYDPISVYCSVFI